MGILGCASPGAGVSSVPPSSWQWPWGHSVWNECWDFFPCNPAAGRGGTGMGSSQCFSVTAEKRSGVVLGAEKTEFPWQNHPFVPYYRAGIPIGKQDCARAEEPARFPHPERSFAPWGRLERAGNGEAEDGAGRFVQHWSPLHGFHVCWHRGCSIKFSMFQLNGFTLKPSTCIPLSFLPLVLCLVFPPGITHLPFHGVVFFPWHTGLGLEGYEVTLEHRRWCFNHREWAL